MSNGNYTKCWHEKGLEGNLRWGPWSADVNGTIVLTVWNNRRDFGDSEYQSIGGVDVLRFKPGDWVSHWKGRRYMEHLKATKASGIPAQVIMIEGRRWPVPSQVRNAYIDPYRYFVTIDDIFDNGEVHGTFHPK